MTNDGLKEVATRNGAYGGTSLGVKGVANRMSRKYVQGKLVEVKASNGSKLAFDYTAKGQVSTVYLDQRTENRKSDSTKPRF